MQHSSDPFPYTREKRRSRVVRLFQHKQRQGSTSREEEFVSTLLFHKTTIEVVVAVFRSSGRAAAIPSFAKVNNLTLRQTAEHCSIGLGQPPLVSATQSIADELQAWIEEEATDSCAVIQPLVIDGLRDFSEHVIPKLVRRVCFDQSRKAKLSERI